VPQFDVSTFSSQIFWLGITFIIFYAVLKRSIIPRMSSLLHTRWEHTEGHVKRSDDLMSEADLLGQTYEKEILEAREEARSIIQKAQEKMSALASREKSQILHQINFKLEADKRRIEEEKSRLLAQVEQAAQGLVEDVYQKAMTPSHPALKEDLWKLT
jgi:F-type H+-transporting ATPase subunit b